MHEDDEDEDGDFQRLVEIMEGVAENVGGPVLHFDGQQLRLHPALATQLVKPENEALGHLLVALGEEMQQGVPRC